MMVIPYEDKYYEEVVSIVDSFFEDIAPKDFRITREEIDKSFIEYKDNIYLYIQEGECVGVIAGKEIENFYSDYKTFQEFFFYVRPEHKAKAHYFIRKVEQLIKDKGFEFLIMACIHSTNADRLFEFYRTIGYNPFETHFIKRI